MADGILTKLIHFMYNIIHKYMIPVLVQIVVKFLRRSLTHLDMKSRSTSDEL